MHILATAMHLFKTFSLDDIPCITLFLEGCVGMTSLERNRLMMVALQELAKQFVDKKAIFKEETSVQS